MPSDSSSAKPSSSGRSNHYHVAVGSQAYKLITLAELLGALQEQPPFGVAVCCRSRDVLDSLLHGLLHHGFDSGVLACLHSDMGERERRMVLADFKRWLSPDDEMQTAAEADSAGLPGDVSGLSPTTRFMIEAGMINGATETAGAPAPAAPSSGPRILALTDVCLKYNHKELQELQMRLLVNFDLPARKEIYQRRMTAFLGAKGRRSDRGAVPNSTRGSGTVAGKAAVVHLVVAGEAQLFREVEGYASSPIVEVPMCVSDMLS